MTVLEKILAKKKITVEETKRQRPFSQLRKDLEKIEISSKSLYRAIKRQPNEPIKLIAEIKRASPTKGKFKNFDIELMSDIYVSSGADAISVITEEDFFFGSPEFLIRIKNRHPQLPVLRKDFIFDEYQIYESKLLKVDAVLLIANILNKDQCKNLYELAKSLGIDVLFEIHDEEDLEKALFVDADIIGINNRNLKTLEVDINTTFRLKGKIPQNKIVVSESGISEKSHIIELLKCGVDAVLVGTSIILSDNPGEKIRELKFLFGSE
ncbi:MAG: indole-3-glycerol phosphate synthase TrpC [Thermodesulfovibrionaceae bacterium]